jgi:hypothetical protein
MATSARGAIVSWLPALLTAVQVGTAAGVTNTGFDASGLSFVTCNGRAGFRTSEFNQGNTDLTGDGDAIDAAFQVLDLGTSVITNVAIDGGGALACGGDQFAFGVREAYQANTDLNGDGDAFDSVLHVWAGAATLTNKSLALTYAVASPSLIVFTVNETAQGLTDLNADGDTLDDVLHVLDPTSGIVTNVGQEAGDTANIKVTGTTVAFRTSEAAQGNTDLNGDSDTLDSVVQIYQAPSATLTNTMRPTPALPGIQLGSAVAAFLVEETAHGPSPLNGDPDTFDSVLHLYCLGAPPCVSTGLINVGIDASGGFTLEGDLVAFRTAEANEPGPSLNPPDLDDSDRVVQVYRLSTGTVTNTGFAAKARVKVIGNLLAMGVRERLQNKTDLNGDLDASDIVLHVYDVGLASATNTGLALWSRSCRREVTKPAPRAPCLTTGTDTLLFAVAERSQGLTDLNGDGDSKDAVVHAWKLSTATPTNTGLAGDHKSTLLMQGTLGGFRVTERDQGVNLNGDLDAKDKVMTTFDATTSTATVLGEAADELFLLEGANAVFRTNEGQENADRNGDADLQDAVLQYEP